MPQATTRVITGLACLALLSGCDLLTGQLCTDQYVMGIGITVVDSVTSRAPLSEVFFRVVDGAFVDTLRYTNDDPDLPDLWFSSAGERPGTYRVEVNGADYLPWVRERVRVKMDGAGCHVEPVRLTARLQPE